MTFDSPMLGLTALVALSMLAGCGGTSPSTDVQPGPPLDGATVSVVDAVRDLPGVAFVELGPTAAPAASLPRARHDEGPPGSTSQHFLEMVELPPAPSAGTFTIFLPSPCVVRGTREVAIASGVTMYGGGPAPTPSGPWRRARVVDVSPCPRPPWSGVHALAGSHEAVAFHAVDRLGQTNPGAPESEARTVGLPDEEVALLHGDPGLTIIMSGVRPAEGQAAFPYRLFQSWRDTHPEGDLRVRRDGALVRRVASLSGFFQANGKFYAAVGTTLVPLSRR